METSVIVRKMSIVMLIAALVIIVAGAAASIYFPELRPISFALGVLLSTGLNIIKVFWLDRAVKTATAMEDQKTAANYIRLQYLLRFLFTALVLLIAVFVPFIELLGAVIGIFTFHVAKYAIGPMLKNSDSNIM